MRTHRFFTATALAAALAFAAAAAYAAMTMSAEEPVHEKHSVIKLKMDDIAPDAIVLEDLHDLEVGESRSFPTESGKIVVATRTESGFEIEVDGKTLQIGELGGPGHAMVWHSESGDMTFGDGEDVVFHKRIEISGDDDENGKTIVWHSQTGGPGRVQVIERQSDGDAPKRFAFATGKDVVVAPFSAEGWIERLEKTESFQQLDEATRELVRRAMREAGEQAHSGDGVFLIDIEEKEQ